MIVIGSCLPCTDFIYITIHTYMHGSIHLPSTSQIQSDEDEPVKAPSPAPTVPATKPAKASIPLKKVEQKVKGLTLGGSAWSKESAEARKLRERRMVNTYSGYGSFFYNLESSGISLLVLAFYLLVFPTVFLGKLTLIGLYVIRHSKRRQI